MTLAKVYNMQQARQKQEDPLNLQSLPMVSPRADGWPAVEAALRGDARRRALWRYAGGALAAAATVTLALGLYLRAPTDGGADAADDLASRSPDEQATILPDTRPPVATDEATAAGPATLDALVALSQQLETRLRAARAGGGSLPASAVVYQVELEDLVIQVDEELSRRPDSLALWSQRVSLLMDLEQLYENRLRREYHRMASL
jgi:HPt (histidine-containing phosphotransfer) domain-containing protein